MPALTLRQFLALAVVGLLTAGAILAAALDRHSLALICVALLLASIFAGLIQLRRRVGDTRSRLSRLGRGTHEARSEATSLRAEVRPLGREIELVRREVGRLRRDLQPASGLDADINSAERRIVGSLESERLAAAERHEALLAGLRDLRGRLEHSEAGTEHLAMIVSTIRELQRAIETGDS